jgi:hypothetical protein
MLNGKWVFIDNEVSIVTSGISKFTGCAVLKKCLYG